MIRLQHHFRLERVVWSTAVLSVLLRYQEQDTRYVPLQRCVRGVWLRVMISYIRVQIWLTSGGSGSANTCMHLLDHRVTIEQKIPNIEYSSSSSAEYHETTNPLSPIGSSRVIYPYCCSTSWRKQQRPAEMTSCTG